MAADRPGSDPTTAPASPAAIGPSGPDRSISTPPGGDDPLSQAYHAYLARHPDPPGGALLAQTVAIAPLRRSFAPLVPLRPGWRVLDLGTGFGPVAFELAHREPVQVTGVDLDPRVLSATEELAGLLGGWLATGSSVELVEGPAESLPFEDASFDLVTASLLFQHVPEPHLVAGEMSRVLRPGGIAFAFDVDDGLGVSYPDDGPMTQLHAAFTEWQASYGGDRQIGRKLSSLFAECGFAIAQVHVLPQAQHAVTRPGDPTRVATAARLRAARDGIVGAGILDGATFDGLLVEYELAPPMATCQIESRIAVVAVKPPRPDDRAPHRGSSLSVPAGPPR